MSRRPADYGRVAVLMGGWAAEREISLASGRAVLESLLRSGVDAVGIDVGRDILTRMVDERFDRAFVILHGRGGEDGVIQGALEVLGLPYTGSGVLGSALAMDKQRCKLLWRAMGVPVPPGRVLRHEKDLALAGELGFPLMVKPVHEGSSLGMARAEDRSGLEAAWRIARKYDSDVLAERWVDGVEYTASVLAGEALPLIRLETPREFYDYQAKYEADDTRYICPCGLEPGDERRLQRLALKAFEGVGASGWGRVDFICDRLGEPWFIEVNTVPGMTSHSLVPMAARQNGMAFDALVLKILDTAAPVDPGVAGGTPKHDEAK